MSKPKPKTRENLLTPEQIRTVESVIRNDKESLAFHGLIYTGLRVSEFIHLNSSWRNFTRKLITIPDKQKCDCMNCEQNRRDLRSKKNKKMNKRQEIRLNGFWVPKTAASERTIPIVEEVESVLYSFFEKHYSILEIFPARQYVNNVLKRLEKRSGVTLFPHCLRGTFATMLAIKGFDPYEIRDSLGWADVNVASAYIKLSGAVLKEAFDEKWKREYR